MSFTSYFVSRAFISDLCNGKFMLNEHKWNLSAPDVISVWTSAPAVIENNSLVCVMKHSDRRTDTPSPLRVYSDPSAHERRVASSTWTVNQHSQVPGRVTEHFPNYLENCRHVDGQKSPDTFTYVSLGRSVTQTEFCEGLATESVPFLVGVYYVTVVEFCNLTVWSWSSSK
jgi:hypothetical protein